MQRCLQRPVKSCSRRTCFTKRRFGLIGEAIALIGSCRHSRCNERRDEVWIERGVRAEHPVVLAEMTLLSLLSGKDVDHADFLARADILGTLSFDVLISRF